jgi:hypothetical protein
MDSSYWKTYMKDLICKYKNRHPHAIALSPVQRAWLWMASVNTNEDSISKKIYMAGENLLQTVFSQEWRSFYNVSSIHCAGPLGYTYFASNIHSAEEAAPTTTATEILPAFVQLPTAVLRKATELQNYLPPTRQSPIQTKNTYCAQGLSWNKEMDVFCTYVLAAGQLDQEWVESLQVLGNYLFGKRHLSRRQMVLLEYYFSIPSLISIAAVCEPAENIIS